MLIESQLLCFCLIRSTDLVAVRSLTAIHAKISTLGGPKFFHNEPSRVLLEWDNDSHCPYADLTVKFPP